MKTRAALRAMLYHALLLLPGLLLILCTLPLVLLLSRIWLACTLIVLFLSTYYILLYRRYKQMLFNRILLAPHRAGMSEEYRQTLRYAGYDARSSYWISASYDAGDYQSVVDICTYYLRHPRRRQPPKYFYLRFLANVYRSVGDRDKLEKVCDAYDNLLAREPSPAKFRYFAPIFADHRAYLTDGQAEIQPTEQPLDTVAEILPTENFKPKATLCEPTTVATTVLLYVLAWALIVTVSPSMLEVQYQRRMAKLCVPAVKQTHVDAEYLAYLPIYTEDEYLADLCLYELNGVVWVGELYVRTNHMDVPLISPSKSVSISLLEDGTNSPIYLTVPGFVNDIDIHCTIYKSEDLIPDSYGLYEDFELNGHTYYFVVTKIITY